MRAKIYISGRIGTEDSKLEKGNESVVITSLLDVVRQYKSYGSPTEVLAEVDSIGGSVDEANKIYTYLDGLKSDGVVVNTYIKRAWSAAAKVGAVGEIREVEDIDNAVMIHNPYVKGLNGGAEKLEAVAEKLREVEGEFSDFYSTFLDVDKETVSALLEEETYLSADKAVELGYATKKAEAVEAVAEFNIENNKANTMEKKEKSFIEELIALGKKHLGKSDEIVAEVTLQDANGVDVVFPDVEEGVTPMVGDKATVDGKAIEDGSYIMPSVEESTFVFVGGEITEIIEKEEEEEEPKPKPEEEEEVVAEEIKEVISYPVTVTNTTFEEGEVVMLEGWGDEEPYHSGAREFEIPDGRKIVTDSAGVIVKIKPAPAVEEEVVAEKTPEELRAEIKAELEAAHKVELDEKKAEILALKKNTTSKEVIVAEDVVETQEQENKVEKSRASQILAAAKQ